MTETNESGEVKDIEPIKIDSALESVFESCMREQVKEPSKHIVVALKGSLGLKTRLMHVDSQGKAIIYNLRKPHAQTIAGKSIRFWVDQEPLGKMDSPQLKLVLAEDDPTRFYYTDHDGDPDYDLPVSEEESQQIVSRLLLSLTLESKLPEA